MHWAGGCGRPSPCSQKSLRGKGCSSPWSRSPSLSVCLRSALTDSMLLPSCLGGRGGNKTGTSCLGGEAGFLVSSVGLWLGQPVRGARQRCAPEPLRSLGPASDAQRCRRARRPQEGAGMWGLEACPPSSWHGPLTKFSGTLGSCSQIGTRVVSVVTEGACRALKCIGKSLRVDCK